MRRTLAVIALLGLGVFGASAATYSGNVGPYGVTITEPSAPPTVSPTVPPTAPPSAPPTPTPTTQPQTGIYATLFSTGSPMRTTVAQHKAKGATLVPQAYMNSLWSQGGVSWQDLSPSGYMSPIYTSTAADPPRVASCTGYGTCNANGMTVHVPQGAIPEQQGDGHIAVIDTSIGYEVDMWNCHNSNPLVCTWGGRFALGGSGITNSGSEAFHGGYTPGIVAITAAELINGHIDHALAIATKCLNNPTIYPADPNNGGTDAACSGGGNAPPHYGNLVHLVWTPAQIAASAYSAECKTVLTALATYGAYTYDTGNPGLSLLSQGAISYTALGKPNPWALTIIPHLQASGDASGTYWGSCLNRLNASAFEMLAIPAGAY